MADFFEIKNALDKKDFKPVYFLDGDEPFYIDELIRYFEEKILTPEERDFNLMVLYGKETSWQDVVNAARRFPMFAEKTIVILREAAQLKDLVQLESYIAAPSPSTILVIDHRNKTLDARTKFAKTVKSLAVYYSSVKLKDEEIPFWIGNYAKSQGYKIPDRELEMLALYLGNDLQKITNELEKIRINEPGLTELTAPLIEKYIGISKEYNVVDLPTVLFSGNTKKLSRMINYFSANPKSAPMPLVIGMMYNFLSKMMLCHYAAPNFGNDRKLGIWSHHRNMAQHISLSYTHKCIRLLEEYSHRAVGVDDNNSDVTLLREMTAKMINLLHGFA